MNKPQLNINIKSSIKILYRYVFPSIVVCLLLIISPKLPRALFLDSSFFDLLARIWLSVIFGMGYIILSDLEKYQSWFYQGKGGNANSNSDIVTRVFNVTMSIMLGTFAAIVSWWSIHTFLPIFNSFALGLALLNGVICFAPLFYKRDSFHL